MTIQFKAQWQQYEQNGVYTLSGAEEARLIGLGIAMPYVSPASPASGGGAWGQTPFSSAIAFVQSSVMSQLAISAALTFSIDAAGATPGVSCYVRLIADGTNAPNFSAFKEWGGSLGWNNTAGILNQVTFFYDGFDYWYSVSQQVGAVALPVPTLVSAVIPSGAPATIVLTYSQALDAASTPASSAYTITNTGGADAVTSVVVSGSTVTLNKSRTSLNTDSITLAYASPATGKVQTAAGMPAASLASQIVTNSLPGASTVMRLTVLTGITETGDANGWTYNGSSTGDAYGGAASGASDKYLPSGQDGWIQYTLPADYVNTNGGPFLAFKATRTTGSYTTAACGVYIDAASDAFRFAVGAAGGQTPNGAIVTPAANMLVRMERTGGQAFAKVSSNGGSSWTTLHTFTAPAGDMYAALLFATGNANAVNLRGSGVI